MQALAAGEALASGARDRGRGGDLLLRLPEAEHPPEPAVRPDLEVSAMLGRVLS